MDSSSAALFKDREKFAKRQVEAANFLASNKKRQKLDKPSSQKTNRPKPTMNRSKTSSDFTSDFSSSNPSSETRFLKLKNVVEALQGRYLGGQIEPVTLDELIKECNLTIDESVRHWLRSEALLDNPKVDVKKIDDVNKFVYKPPLDLKARKKLHLLNLLKSRHEKCEGAITVDDVRDTIPKAKADLIIENLIKSGDVVKVIFNKKEILFYTERDNNLNANKEFIETWRKISVEDLDDKKLWEDINNHGYYGLKKDTPQHMHVSKKPNKTNRRHANTMKHNEHVADQLIDFSNIPTTK